MYRPFAFLLLVALTSLSESAEAADRHVGAGQAHTTIQGAVNASSSGDTIIVHAGTYAERVVIDNVDELFIKANGTDIVVIDPANTFVNAILAINVDLHVCNVEIQAPHHMSPAQRGIQFNSNTTSAVEEFYLHLYRVDIVGTNVTGGQGVACAAGTNDTLNLGEWDTTITTFPTPVGPSCARDTEWPWEEDWGTWVQGTACPF